MRPKLQVRIFLPVDYEASKGLFHNMTEEQNMFVDSHKCIGTWTCNMDKAGWLKGNCVLLANPYLFASKADLCILAHTLLIAISYPLTKYMKVLWQTFWSLDPHHHLSDIYRATLLLWLHRASVEWGMPQDPAVQCSKSPHYGWQIWKNKGQLQSISLDLSRTVSKRQ